jgi:hypothetical protein
VNLPTIPQDQKASILACFHRLRIECFGGSKDLTFAFLRRCAGDFGIPEPLQGVAVSMLFDQLYASTPLPNPPPPLNPPVVIPPAPMQSGMEAIDATKIDTITGTPCARQKITRRLESARFNGDSVSWKGDGRDGWPRKQGRKETDGQVSLFFEHGGQIIGGVFDATGIGQTHKDLFNVHVDPAKGLAGKFRVEPARGQKCWLCVQSWGDERTQIIECENGYGEK